jgi:hypothetical protein
MRNSRKGRFRVWDRSQDAFSGEDLVYNFDEMDKLLGGPGGFEGTTGNTYSGTPTRWLGPGDLIPPRSNSKYPGTTNGGAELQSGQRTLYTVVSGLNYNDVPLGTVIAWWRPASSIPVPNGWAICDGQSVIDHSFPLDASITLPDLRNKFIIGADPNIPGINAVNGYVHESGAQPAQNIDNVWSGQATAENTGAPGIGWDSGLESSNKTGSNSLRTLTHSHGAGELRIRDHFHGMNHTHQLPAHNHPLSDHTHDHRHIHLTPDHCHDFGGATNIRTNAAPWGEGYFIRVKATSAQGDPFVATADHTHPINASGFGVTGNRNALSNNRGFYPSGPTASPWFYPTPPSGNLIFNRGYGPANLTSYPTQYRTASGPTAVGHEEIPRTSGSIAPGDVPLVSTIINNKSGFVSEGASTELTQEIKGSTSTTIADSKKLDNQTGNPVLPNLTVGDPGVLQANIRGQYVGMLYLMKIKVSTNVI